MDLNPMLLSLLHGSGNKLHSAPHAQSGGVAYIKLLLVSTMMPATNRDVSPLQKLPHAGTTWCAPTRTAS